MSDQPTPNAAELAARLCSISGPLDGFPAPVGYINMKTGVVKSRDTLKRQPAPGSWLPFNTQDEVHELLRTQAARIAELEAGEPNMRHPKIQALIGGKARREIELQLVDQLLDDPDCDLSPMEMEYWYGLHDKLRAALKDKEAALAQQVPEPQAAVLPGDPEDTEDLVTIPRGLVGAACSAIDHKRDAPKLLEKLRRYTVGDLSRGSAQQVPAVPEGFKLIAVKGFDELCQALDRADRKGYMPDAIADEWAAFDYELAAAPLPTPEKPA